LPGARLLVGASLRLDDPPSAVVGAAHARVARQLALELVSLHRPGLEYYSSMYSSIMAALAEGGGPPITGAAAKAAELYHRREFEACLKLLRRIG
jgi:hypothetical protein